MTFKNKAKALELRINYDFQYWLLNNRFHRLNGPAIITFDGCQLWYQNDKLHRIDGPAIISHNGTQEWWVNDKRIK